jgi:hypothetical protein
MNDYRCIDFDRGEEFRPHIAAEEHAKSRAFIERTLGGAVRWADGGDDAPCPVAPLDRRPICER